MSDEKGFIRAIQESPEDDTVRLAYADWLDEHDWGPRAELIRAQCALATLVDDDAARGTLEKQSAELLARHGASWSKGLPGKVQWWRGFPEVFEVRVSDCLRHTKSMERLAPVQRIRLYELDEDEDERPDDPDGQERDRDFIRLMRSPLLERWVDLEIGLGFLGVYDEGKCFKALAAAPHLTRLRRLSLHGNDRLGKWVCLVANPKFAQLTHLDIFNSNSFAGGPGDEGIAQIVTSPHMGRLEYLDIGACDVSDDGLCALAASPHMSRLRTLKVDSCYFKGPGIRALATSNSLPNLAHLHLCWGGSPGSNLVSDLIDGPLLSRLRGLDIGKCELEDSHLVRLAACPDVSGLRYLGIGDDRLSAAGVESLLHSPSLSQLSHLEWYGRGEVGLADEIASVLIGAPQLTRLTVFVHEENRPDEEMIRRLQDRFTLMFRWE
jgi:uncharacterized protein (TIGR02996 family)